jgi:hypothetical protein
MVATEKLNEVDEGPALYALTLRFKKYSHEK